MLLLVTDTSGRDGFVGLVRASEDAQPANIDVIEEVPLAGGTFSAQLVPQIAALLEKHGFRKTDIAAFIVVSGPGSFTGLRVGLAAIKALAEILHRPIVAVSVLEVLAPYSHMIAAIHNVPDGLEVLRYAVALDASRGDAFVGEYELVIAENAENSSRGIGESLRRVDDLAALLESGSIQWIATPDQAIFDALRGRVSESKKRSVRRNLRRPRCEEIALVGRKKLAAGETVSPEQLEANYIRCSDAEIFSKPATGS
jgi:tRNA threonylcarbamoyladenosine biosynthesis protein TsaB